MEIKKIKKIKVSQDNIQRLAEEHGCTISQVYNALAFRSQSVESEKIRQEAIRDHNGVVFYDIKFI